MTFGPYRCAVTDDNTPAIPLDLTGAIVTGQVRKVLPVEGASPPADEFLLDLDILRAPGNGLDAHEFMFGLSAAKTDTLKPGLSLKDPAGKYEYDIQVQYADGTIRPYLYGTLTSFREVTRP
jgi:hypothetical protein